MGLMCKIFGHKLERNSGTGINPKTLRYVHRTATYCTKCDYIVREEKDVGSYDYKKGKLSINSGGPCYICKNKQSCEYPAKIIDGCYDKCPIDNYEFTDEIKESFAKWDDTLL
jgi:hypothetical protein